MLYVKYIYHLKYKNYVYHANIFCDYKHNAHKNGVGKFHYALKRIKKFLCNFKTMMIF